MDMSKPRYAIYFVPEQTTRLGQFGDHWFGRTSEKLLVEEVVTGLSVERYQKIIQSPRHYGFHGTLKAPFELHSNYNFQHLDTALTEFCNTFSPFNIGALALRAIADFIALVPENDLRQLQQLHQRLIKELNNLRAPLSNYDRDRFIARNLTHDQEGYLDRYGYPFVLNSFKFHLTLTSSLPEQERTACFKLLDNMTADFRHEVVPVNRICLFKQKTRQAPFFIVKEYTLREFE